VVVVAWLWWCVVVCGNDGVWCEVVIVVMCGGGSAGVIGNDMMVVWRWSGNIVDDIV
jgi:hypothetical protein